MFDPETLRTFISVAETGSFSKAAERLCKTTATISYRIKLLEENTGVGLFFRTTRSVSLTAAGSHLLSQAKDWLAWLDSMPDELRQVNDGVERQVNIVVNTCSIARKRSPVSYRGLMCVTLSLSFTFPGKFIWASGIRSCMKVFRWRLA